MSYETLRRNGLSGAPLGSEQVQFQILGHQFVSTYQKGKKGKYQVVVVEKKWTSLKTELKQITRKTAPLTFDQRIAQLKTVYLGWINYFRMASIQSKLRELDGWLPNRLRYCIWENWKKPERKRKNLIRLGESGWEIKQVVNIVC